MFIICPHTVHFWTFSPAELRVACVPISHWPKLCPVAGIVSVTSWWHTEQVPVSSPASVQVATFVTVGFSILWPKGSPSVLPQREQVFGSVQVASIQSWPKAGSPISPHLSQIWGVSQVASSPHLWPKVHVIVIKPTKIKITMAAIGNNINSVSTIFFFFSSSSLNNWGLLETFCCSTVFSVFGSLFSLTFVFSSLLMFLLSFSDIIFTSLLSFFIV